MDLLDVSLKLVEGLDKVILSFFVFLFIVVVEDSGSWASLGRNRESISNFQFVDVTILFSSWWWEEIVIWREYGGFFSWPQA